VFLEYSNFKETAKENFTSALDINIRIKLFLLFLLFYLLLGEGTTFMALSIHW